MIYPSSFRALLLCINLAAAAAFTVVAPVPPKAAVGATALAASRLESHSENGRRNLLVQALTAAATVSVGLPLGAMAESVPLLTTDEFLIIVRDSARSIQRVEFSGPKGETVIVRLIDGTAFGLSDVVESSTDPRSPLKVQAACREAKIPFKNLQIEAILASAPKKTKMYTNQRVQDAAAKEKERLERLARDEEERLAALYKLEQEEAKR